MNKPTIVGPIWLAVLDITEGSDNGLTVLFASPKLKIEVSFSIREVARYFPFGIDQHSRVKLWGGVDGNRFVLGNVEQVRLRQVTQSRPGTTN